MSTICATATRRECEPELEYPLPFKDLPPDVQKLAIAKWHDDPDHTYPEWHDVQFLTENLVNDLAHEFGIEVSSQTYPARVGGRTEQRNWRPKLYWGTYRHEVEFECDALDLEKFLAHGVQGCQYYDADIAAVRDLMQTATVIGAMFGVDIEWDCKLREGGSSTVAQAEWNTSEEVNAQQQAQIEPLAEEIRKRLAKVYRTACYRVYAIIEGEIEYHSSDECIRELLEGSDDDFDEEGNLA